MRTNDPNRPDILLACSGQVLSAFTEPVPTVDFGLIREDATEVSRGILLRAGSPHDVTPRVPENLPPGVELKLEEKSLGRGYLLRARLGPPWPNGKFEYIVDMETGLERMPRQPIRFKGVAPQRFTVVPDLLLIPENTPRPLRTPIVVIPRPGHQHRIVRAESTDPMITVELEDSTPQRAIVRVPAEFDLAQSQASIRLISDDESLAPLTVDIRSNEAVLAHRRAQVGEVCP